MIVSEARISANRRNALRSTGPKTEEGKKRSRANALKHGLCASVVVAEDLELLHQRSSEWYFALKPQNEYHCWLVDEIALLSLRIDRSERMERRARDRKSLRAELCWDDDRRLDAEVLGGMIRSKPGEVVQELRRTPQGCEWLMARWAMLAHSADVKGRWTADQNRLAFDLLGTPPEFREGHEPGAGLDFDGQVTGPAHDPAAVARREIAALKERREVVEGLDEADQSLAMADLDDQADPELRRIRRYESTLHSRLRWCLGQLHFQSPHPRPRIDLKPTWAAEPSPKTAPGPEPEPKFEFAPEPVAAVDVDIALTPAQSLRHEKKRKKAEARREARLRKLARLRA